MARAPGEEPNTRTRGAGVTSSRKISTVPPLWQLIGSAVMPARLSRDGSGLSESSRGCPSAITRSASRRTAGAAQAPPIQPW